MPRRGADLRELKVERNFGVNLMVFSPLNASSVVKFEHKKMKGT